ncbi:deaminated glutathione amidase isoform X5 [Calonectris borealis]|uniref:deaminated glutathione amidase isoform X5 n=1 Tax=Calonectris borealis TaxID=1323832 RepID=UPI003F4BB377
MLRAVPRTPLRCLLLAPLRTPRRPHSSSTPGSSPRPPRAMAGPPGLKPLVAVGQVTSTPDKELNFAACAGLVREAARRGACLVFLPEGFDYIGSDTAQTLSLAEGLDGDLMGRYAELARDCGVWLSLGGFHERGRDWPTTQRIYNCHALLDPAGRLVAAYRKTHLCDVELEGRVTMKESGFTNPGTEIVPPVSTPAGKVLLRARAIESQCYVVAAAQTGKNHERRTSYGHALVVDPWGAVVAQCREGPGLCYAEIDLDYLHRVRREIPVHGHRRPDLYGTVAAAGLAPAP